MRPLNRYIKPNQEGMNHLHKEEKKNIYIFFLSTFLWVYSILQADIDIYVIVVWIIAFTMMALNSLFLASVLCISVIGVHISSDVISFIALGAFSGALMIGSVWIISGAGASKKSISGNLDSGNVVGYYGGDGCDSGGDC